MNDKTEIPVPAAAEESFLDQLSMMRKAFMASPRRNTILALCAGILGVILATAFGQIILNRWNQPFYDSIERRDMQAFLYQLVVFAEIAGGLLVLNVGQTWLNQMLRLKLREGLTLDLIGEWMLPRRAFRLANAGAIGVNPGPAHARRCVPPDRVVDGSRRRPAASDGPARELRRRAVVAVRRIRLSCVGQGLRHSGLHGLGGGDLCRHRVVAVLADRPAADRAQRRPLCPRGELRFSLVRVNEHVDAISLAGGEQDERRRLELDLANVLAATRRILGAIVRLTWVTAGYGWITVVAPIVIASPVYFSGDMTFGGLMMAVGAFNQVHSSLRWFVDHIGGIADWRATLLRVAAFRAAMVKADDIHEVEKQISFAHPIPSE